MRSSAIYTLLATIPTILAEPKGYAQDAPFLSPVENPVRNGLLAPRQSVCAIGQSICTAYGSNACCAAGLVCALDQASQVACCPSNVVCTGTIGVTPITTASSSGFVLGSSTITTTTTPLITSTPTFGGGGSTVPNTYYPFVYIPTTYLSAAACSAAWTDCQTQSTSCLVSLAGQNGVTVAGLGFGVTVTGQSGQVLTAASSICSSLSASACYDLELQQCSQFGGVGPGARPTACPRLVYAAGAVVGAMGAML